MGGLAEHVTGWAPEPVEVHHRVDPWPGDAFAALLDQPPPAPAQGDPLPPLWHWFHALDHPATAELGEDGHPAKGRFLPPVPDRRRMFAGGRLRMRAPLRVGDAVVRRSELAAVRPKEGRSGPMLFLTVRHTFSAGGEVRVVEEQDLVYRSQAAGAPRPAPAGRAAAPRSDAAPETGPGAWRLRLRPDEAMLFRFSALTYNGHRIHYDLPYATGVEGYPGLVVHGPLLALLLLELPRRFAPDAQVTGFEYRLRRPAFAGAPVVAAGGPDGLAAGPVGEPASVTGALRLG
ncbi:MAG TPA: MaoC family dehydratase N-terminal domain-containing protein [Pseudonocardia sp.]|nr:MaoC family dehydratase N-terminal domain-containing protein [Pseudonocardia sp.]